MRWLGKITSADMLTLLNGLLGMLAITYVLDGEHAFAAVLIFMCVIVDGMDGIVARRVKKKHDFGRFLDSISDAVSFCLAPGVLIYSNYYDKGLGSAWGSVPNALAVAGSVMFVGFGLLRLARFAGKDFRNTGFRGLPTPAAAMVAVAVCLLWGNPAFTPFSTGYEPYPVLAVLAGISLLMVSEVPYPKIAGRLALVVGTIVAVFVLVMGLYVIETGLELPITELLLILLAMLGGFVIVGPVYEIARPGYVRPERRRRRLRRRDKMAKP